MANSKPNSTTPTSSQDNDHNDNIDAPKPKPSSSTFRIERWVQEIINATQPDPPPPITTPTSTPTEDMLPPPVDPIEHHHTLKSTLHSLREKIHMIGRRYRDEEGVFETTRMYSIDPPSPPKGGRGSNRGQGRGQGHMDWGEDEGGEDTASMQSNVKSESDSSVSDAPGRGIRLREERLARAQALLRRGSGAEGGNRA